jgi:D-alanyl-D-alanine dipeptidase
VVAEALKKAQADLNKQGLTIKIFDAYRPIPVQQFMVDYTLQQLAQTQELDLDTLTDTKREALLKQVYEFWAPPSLNPATPPPHSTGGAIDVTLVDQVGNSVDMGSPIDEISPRSYPNYFAAQFDAQPQTFHHHRQRLWSVMTHAGFQQHPNEWWHFSWGDQMWAWLVNQTDPAREEIARYGRYD